MPKEKYARIGYDKTEDGFGLYMSDDGENWGLDSLFPCVNSKSDKDDVEPEFVHIGLIQKIRECIALGYKFKY